MTSVQNSGDGDQDQQDQDELEFYREIEAMKAMLNEPVAGDGGEPADGNDEKTEQYLAAHKAHFHEGTPLVLPPPLTPRLVWPSPIDEGAGDMENKDLDLHKSDMVPLHTSVVQYTQRGFDSLDETCQSFQDMLNDDSTLSSIGGGDADQDDSICGHNESRIESTRKRLHELTRQAEDLLSSDLDSSMNYSKIEPQITVVKQAILKRDDCMKALLDSHKTLQHQLEVKDEELRQMAGQVSDLQETFHRYAATIENTRNSQVNDLSCLQNDSGAVAEPKANLDQFVQTVESGPSSPEPNHHHAQVVDDLILQVADLDKKLNAKNKFIEELSAERETERDEFHRALEDSEKKFAELKREKDKLEEINAQTLAELDDREEKLNEADQVEQQLVSKAKHSEEELKIAVDKIYELREIIQDLEQQIDSASAKATELKEQNECLAEEIDRLEHKENDEPLNTSQDTITTGTGVPEEVLEDIQTQLSDLTTKLEKKLAEMDSCPWAERPNSACSGGQYASNDDVSVKDVSGLSRTIQATNAPYMIAESLRRLEAHFDALMRFEELIMKKVKDNEIRYNNAKKRSEELESEKLALQEQSKEQILKTSDLQSRLDQSRFEPSPNAVTLTGLRARVNILSEQVEEYKGKLQLKIIENQDVEQKLASAQALVAKYSAQLQLQQQQAASKPTDSQSLEFSPPNHSTPMQLQHRMAVETRRKQASYAPGFSVERETPEVMRNRETAELEHVSASSVKLHESDLMKDNMEKELLMLLRKNQDLEQKLAFAQELIVKSQQTTKVVKIGTTQTEPKVRGSFSTQTDEIQKPRVESTTAQTTELDISTTIQKNAELQNELATASLLIAKLQMQTPKKIAVTQTDSVTKKSIQTETFKGPIKINSQAQTENLQLICGHENEILTMQRKNRDLEHNLACAQEAIAKLQHIKPTKSAFIQTETPYPEIVTEPTPKVSLPNHKSASRPSLPLDFEVHVHSIHSVHDPASNDSWYADDEPNINGHAHKNLHGSLELYLRSKSLRKALCWQKWYLTQVVHGYKDLLAEVGVGTQHSDYFKKQLSILPAAIGAVDRKSPLVRFRIKVRAIIAIIRMKHMVHRWTKRLRRYSQDGAKENMPPPLLPAPTKQPIPQLILPPGVNKTELRNMLTQHFERFKSLEGEIAHTMTNRLKKKEYK